VIQAQTMEICIYSCNLESLWRFVGLLLEVLSTGGERQMSNQYVLFNSGTWVARG